MNIALLTSIYNYTPEQISPWVNSLKKTNFGGQVFAVVYNPENDEMQKYLTANNIHVCIAYLDGETHVATQRFRDYTELLNSEYAKGVEAVIHTDARDVIFQSDPGVWLQNNIQDFKLIASGEGVTFRHEDWNSDTLERHYSTSMYLKLADKETLCSGIIAGRVNEIKQLFTTIYELMFYSANPCDFADQTAYNIAVYEIFRDMTKIVPASDNWCANLGTLKALPENNPTWSTGPRSQYNSFERIRKNKTFKETLLCKMPELREDGLIYAENGKPYSVVHQYDRYQPWKDAILDKFSDTVYAS